MARTVRDTNLETRAARLRLKAQKKPYWRAIERGLHLGYYKGARVGGAWRARFYLGGGKYRERDIGPADDTLDAQEDGKGVRSFKQAQDEARTWFAEQSRIAAGHEPAHVGPYTVASAIKDYLDHYTARGGKARHATEAAADAHIVPALGDLDVAKLTSRRLRDWHHGLAAAQARIRSAENKPQRHRDSKGDPDALRRRQATANRILTILKAALNHAKRDKRIASDDEWRDVKPFHDVDAPVIRYLTEAECARLVNATDAEFRPMVRAAMLTGCRYGELTVLRAADFNPDAGTLTIRASKAGKARHVVLTQEGRDFFEAATAGKSSGALILARPNGEAWGKNHQQRPLTAACKRAKISPAVSFHVLRHTHGSLLAMKGVPMAVIGAQLGHAPGSKMTAKHYAHLSPNYVADTIRASFPKLGIVEKSEVTKLGTNWR